MAKPDGEDSMTAHRGQTGDLACTPEIDGETHRWRMWVQQHAVTVLLLVQWTTALLLGTQLVPLPSLQSPSTVAGWRPTAHILGFFTLSAATAVALWRKSSEQRAERQLLHVAYHDPATNLPNRTAMEHTLDQWLCAHEPVGCLYIEVDGAWKRTEPACETAAGTQAQTLAQRLKPLIRQGDMLAHLSADRFVILLHGAQPRASLVALAERLIDLLSSPVLVQDAPYSVNIGIAVAPGDAKERAGLLAAAKGAMVLARGEERNSFRFADAVGRAKEDRLHMLSGKLRHAILKDQLQLVYQPIYTCRGDLVAAEALARWHDDDEGPISPGEFVPVAEATGLIIPLSKWVLRQACRQMAEWCAMGGPMQRIAVNVSVKQVSRSDFVETIHSTLLESGLSAQRLELEITESALATDFEAVNNNLQALRQSGVRISIDDFGTGYSSLSRVRELNADVLKIDRVFTQGAGESKSGAAMVEAIIGMAHTLELSVIAEGIETREQMSLLRGMACDEMQGFLLARPQSAEVLTQELQMRARAAKANALAGRLVPRMA